MEEIHHNNLAPKSSHSEDDVIKVEDIFIEEEGNKVEGGSQGMLAKRLKGSSISSLDHGKSSAKMEVFPMPASSHGRSAKRMPASYHGKSSSELEMTRSKTKSKSSIAEEGKTLHTSYQKAVGPAYFLDNKLMIIVFLMIPLTFAQIVILYFQGRHCKNGKHNIWCPNYAPEILHLFADFIYFFCGYYLRKEMLEKRNLLLDNVDGVKMGLIGYLLYGTPMGQETKLNPKDFSELLIGTLKGHRMYDLRNGFLALIVIFSNIIGWYNTFQKQPVGLGFMISIPIVGSLVWYSYFLYTRAVFFPFVLISIQIGYTAKYRVGLWDQNDVSLAELQRISMHAVIWFAFISLYTMLLFYNYRTYFGKSLTTLFFYGMFFLFIIISILFLPIIPVITVLRAKKEKLLGNISRQLQIANKTYFDKELASEDVTIEKATLDRLLLYYDYVSKIRTVPSGVEVFNTSIFSLAMTIIPIIIVSII
mmetsp:Transcript_48705/g.62516  ORF Transcript_48705/g.62516 Transcript_48705/m.62516 type:complete len:476 (-) Transcript_48705:52-1479(-)